MAARRIGIVVRKSLHENFFQLIKSVFANHELIKIDVNAGDRGTCFYSFYSVSSRRIGIVVRKSLHENFFQLIKSVFANHELIKIDVNAGDRGTCFHSFYSVSSFKVAPRV